MKKLIMLVMMLAMFASANVLYTDNESAEGTLYGGRYTIYTVNFKGGERADVKVSGDGSSDLDLFVYDQNGNEVCRSRTYGDDEHCSFKPIWSGPFMIKIVNEGRYSNDYTIIAY